jgi:hypothetical protein
MGDAGMRSMKMIIYMLVDIRVCIAVRKNKKGVRIEIQPRFKIQYPMKNRCNINS